MQQPAPQLTFKAITLSVILTVILAAANCYVGLFAGLTVATAIPAAVIAMAVLRLFGPPNILENNIVATGASAGSSIASGAIFTLPALILLHHWQRFDYWWTLAIVGLGGVLGVLFSVPLRRTLIIDQKLLFPEGVAAAEVLKVSVNPGESVKVLGLAALAGGAFKFMTSGVRWMPESFTLKGFIGERGIAFFSYGFSPALLAVGYIVGLNVAVLVALGGFFSWWLAIPLYNVYFHDMDPALASQLVGLDPEGAAVAIWRAQVRYIGVGCMLTGAFWALWSLRKSLWRAVRSGLAASSRGGEVAHTERDLPMSGVLVGIVLLVFPLFLLYHAVVGQIGVSLAMAVIMIVAGFLFSSVSGYMAGLVGSSNNPVSGITICTILFASLVLLWMLGPEQAHIGAVAVVLIGAVVCSAASVAGDNLQDLKAGQLVGSTPWRQQVMLAIGALAGASVMAPVLNVLLDAYGIGEPAHPGVKPLSAPQATLVKSVAEGMFGGQLPTKMIALGAIIGALIIAIDLYLKRRKSRWSAPVLAVAVGIYLPLDVSTPILAGGIVAELVDVWHRRHGTKESELEQRKQNGMLFAAGLITGEALIGILVAIAISATKNADILAMSEIPGGQWLAAVVLIAICMWMYRAGTPRNAA